MANQLVSGLLTSEIEKLLIRKGKRPYTAEEQEADQRKKKRESAQGIIVKMAAKKFGEDENRVTASLRYLWEKGLITLPKSQTEEPNWDSVSAIEIDGLEIQARLVYKSANLFSEKTREELGRETVATADSVIRFGIVEERQGDAFTGFYLMSVQENPDNDGRYLLADQRIESKAAAWAWWDQYKGGLDIIEPAKPALEVEEGGSKKRAAK